MCGGKVGYPDQYAAIAAAVRASSNIGPCRYYRCPICKSYHLTTSNVEVYGAKAVGE